MGWPVHITRRAAARTSRFSLSRALGPGEIATVTGGETSAPDQGMLPVELSLPPDVAWKVVILDARVGVEPVLQGGGPASYTLKPVTMYRGMLFSVTVKNLSGGPVLFSAQVKSVDKSSPRKVSFGGWPKAQR